MSDSYLIAVAAAHLHLPFREELLTDGTKNYHLGSYVLGGPHTLHNETSDWVLAETATNASAPGEVEYVECWCYPELTDALAALAQRDFTEFLKQFKEAQVGARELAVA